MIGPLGYIQFGTGNLKPPEEEGSHQYCCFTDREGEQSLIISDAGKDMYTYQAAHFLACIRGEETCLSPGTEAVKAIAVADAILQAGREGRGGDLVIW